MRTFYWPVRVYYEDTDHGGVVYHANYLKFMERARSEWLRSFGLEQDQLMAEHGILFAVHQMTLDFKAPALFNQQLNVSVELCDSNRVTLDFHQQVRLNDKVYCQAQVRVVCLDAQTKKPRRMPPTLFAVIKNEQKSN